MSSARLEEVAGLKKGNCCHPQTCGSSTSESSADASLSMTASFAQGFLQGTYSGTWKANN